MMTSVTMTISLTKNKILPMGTQITPTDPIAQRHLHTLPSTLDQINTPTEVWGLQGGQTIICLEEWEVWEAWEA